MAGTPVTKADFETAYGRPLTDEQYYKLRMGLQMGMLDNANAVPRSTGSMSPEQASAIGRLNWLAAGRPGEPGGGNLFDAAPQTQAAAPKPKKPTRAGGKVDESRAKSAPGEDSGPADERAPGDEPAPMAKPLPYNGWEGNYAPQPETIFLGQYATPQQPTVFAATQLPKGNGDVVAAQQKAKVDVAALEKDAAKLPKGDSIASAQAKAKKDAAALEADAAKLPAPTKQTMAAPVPKPVAPPQAAAPATYGGWNQADPAAKQKAWADASNAAGKSLTGGEFQMQMQQAQAPAAPPAPAMSVAPAPAPATAGVPAGAPSKADVEAKLGKSISDQEYVAYVTQPKYPQYVPVPQAPTLKGLAF